MIALGKIREEFGIFVRNGKRKRLYLQVQHLAMIMIIIYPYNTGIYINMDDSSNSLYRMIDYLVY